MTSKRRTFTKQFKQEAVALATAADRPVSEIERDLGLPRGLLYRWRRELASDGEHAFPGHGSLKPDDEEMRRLRRENDLLREERDILKKALGIFSQERRR
ncbi:MAG TPA: hypothetical protein DD727_06190 [Clostridiales bacterium]|nr:hypothetical protein [Clostridiales bacterium]